LTLISLSWTGSSVFYPNFFIKKIIKYYFVNKKDNKIVSHLLDIDKKNVHKKDIDKKYSFSNKE
jgi:hypothetical protein